MTTRPHLIAVALSALLIGCVAGDETTERGPIDGKADHLRGECLAEDCGGPSSTGLGWCDDVCAIFGDCAENIADVCGFNECMGDDGCGADEFCSTVFPPNVCKKEKRPEGCGDGTPALCEIIPPTCPDGLVLEIVNHCFGACVDPDTCEAPPAPTGEACGDTFCEEGMICCNSSCGLCTPPGFLCHQQVCE